MDKINQFIQGCLRGEYSYADVREYLMGLDKWTPEIEKSLLPAAQSQGVFSQSQRPQGKHLSAHSAAGYDPQAEFGDESWNKE